MNTKHVAVFLYTLPLFLTGMVTRLIGAEHIGQTVMVAAFITLTICGAPTAIAAIRNDLKELMK